MPQSDFGCRACGGSGWVDLGSLQVVPDQPVSRRCSRCSAGLYVSRESAGLADQIDFVAMRPRGAPITGARHMSTVRPGAVELGVFIPTELRQRYERSDVAWKVSMELEGYIALRRSKTNELTD